MELKELIAGAQEAMDQGDFRLTIAAGNHALVGYDACLAAHRLLGEAHLEQGDHRSAITHFERAISIDPLNVVARLGLGVAAEETKQYADAYAHYLHAWEINPALDQVRDELVRLRGLLNVEDRLHPSRAGLAGIHARSGQFARAAVEWRAVLSVEPESRRARTALAELLWRQGDDAGAAQAAREALRGCPDNARALAILADVEKRRNGGQLADISQRYAAVDPTGEVVDHLRQWRSDAEFDALLPDSILIDDFDFNGNRSHQTSGLGRKSITGTLAANQIAAPDLWDTLVKDLSSDGPHRDAPTLATGVEPFSWSEGSPPDNGQSEPPRITASPYDDLGDVFPTLADTIADDVGATAEQAAPEPFASATPSEPALGQPDADAEDELAAAIPPPIDSIAAAADPALGLDDFQTDLTPFSFDDITGVAAPAHTTVSEDMLSAIVSAPAAANPPHAGESPVASLSSPTIPDYVDPFVTADGRIDLTAGWDNLDQEIQSALPSDNGDSFDALVAELGVDGIIPFDADVESPDEDAWAPFSNADFGSGTPEPPVSLDTAGIDLALPDATGDAIELADLEVFDVTSFVGAESEPELAPDIVTGIPLPEPSGYTELLRNIDEDSPPELESDSQIDPFANPDATGAPLAFDDLIEVTSTDGTGPLVSKSGDEARADELDFSSLDLSAAMPAIDDLGTEFDLQGIEPFDSSAITGLDDRSLESEAGAPFASLEVTAEPDGIATSDVLSDDLANLAPFDFTELPAEDPDGAAMDFTEMDATPGVFDAAPPDADAGAELIAALPTADDVAPTSEPVAEPPFVEEPTAEPGDPIELAPAAEAEFALAESEYSDPVPAESIEGDRAEAPDVGVIPAEHSIPWPHFMSQTSTLMDRDAENETLFARIAAQKAALIEMGVVRGVRRLHPVPPSAPSAPVVTDVEPVQVSPHPRFTMNEQVRMDLMAMRVRLIEDASAAHDIAEQLEDAIDNGLQSPLAMRVLGEAYLKLGMVEQAAAQFRQAMLTRRGA